MRGSVCGVYAGGGERGGLWEDMVNERCTCVLGIVNP